MNNAAEENLGGVFFCLLFCLENLDTSA